MEDSSMHSLKLLLIAFAASLLSTAASAQVINGCIKPHGTLKVAAAAPKKQSVGLPHPTHRPCCVHAFTPTGG